MKHLRRILLLVLFILCCAYVFADSSTTLSLQSPADRVWRTSRNVNFTFTPLLHGNVTIRNCSVWTNASGTFALSQSNITGNFLANNSVSYINYSFASDGTYLWNVECFNNESVSNTSTANGTLFVDATSPTMVFASSSYANNSWRATLPIFVNVTVTETNKNYTSFLFYNTTGSLLSTTNLGSGFNLTLAAPKDGNYTVTVMHFDKAGSSVTASRYYKVDATAPSALTFGGNTLANRSWRTVNYFFVNLSALTEANQNYTMFMAVNSSGDLVSMTNVSVGSDYVNNFTSLSQENYTVTVRHYDKAGNSKSANYYYYVDLFNPMLRNGTRNQPHNKAVTSTRIFFNVSASDRNEKNITFRLYNMSGKVINTTTSTSGARSINWSVSKYGCYKYNASMYDDAARTNKTSTFRICVYRMSGFSDTLSSNRNWTSVNLRINNSYANVTWTGIDLSSSSLDFNTYVKVSSQNVTINSDVMGALDTSAKIVMRGLSFVNTPKILKDGSACSDCSGITYSSSAGTLSFTVTGFSSYTLESQDGGGSRGGSGGGGGGGGTYSSGYCGNGLCEASRGETDSSCPEDCFERSTTLYQTGTYGMISGGLQADSDRDGLSDYDETNYYFTDPYSADSDSDGTSDRSEALAKTTPGDVKRGDGGTRLSLQKFKQTSTQEGSVQYDVWSYLVPLLIIVSIVGLVVWYMKVYK